MKTAIIFGSSGLIGNQILKLLINDDNYNKIKIFVRSAQEINIPKVEMILTDFKNLDNYKDNIKGDDCYFCIGTTKKNAPDKNEYRRIEYNIPVEVAKIAKSNSIKSFIYVSSGFADPNSSGDYLKNKGEAEEDLKKLNFTNLVIMRPAFLMGNRKEKRIGEKLGLIFFKIISLLFLGKLKKMKPIHSEFVARAMIKVANNNFQKTIFESNEIVELNNS